MREREREREKEREREGERERERGGHRERVSKREREEARSKKKKRGICNRNSKLESWLDHELADKDNSRKKSSQKSEPISIPHAPHTFSCG